MQWIDFLVPFGTAAAGAAAVYGTFVRPRQKVHEQHEKERADQRRKSDAFMFGVAPIEGVTDGALSAPRRLQAVEIGLTKNTDAVMKLGEWQKEANGTAKKTSDAVVEIRAMIQDLVQTGVTTKINLGKDATDVALLTAESQTALLDAIHQHVDGENLTSG